jgi:glycosyltransferase involved in cell wall biosynthesis
VPGQDPEVSVVVPTRDRPERLARTLAALRAQTLDAARFEVVVADDASGPETAALLEREARDMPLRVVRLAQRGGAARARNAAWRAARAPLIASTDDDCEPAPGWLEAGLAAWGGDPRRCVQGRTLPVDPEREAQDVITLRVEALGPWYETANMFYPRAALEQVGGFDETAYTQAGGEDTDLAWTLIRAGWTFVWAPDALVHHAVVEADFGALVRKAWRWDETILVFRRYPELRRHLTFGVFWTPNHWWLLRALGALALPSRLWWLRWWLAAPYVLRLGSPRPDRVARLVVNDAVELAACARGAVRYRVPVL